MRDTVSFHSIPAIYPYGSMWRCPYLHYLILQLGKEEVHDLVLLDRQRVQVDLLHTLYLPCLHETTQLGHRLPFLLLALVPSATRPTTSAAPTSTLSASLSTARTEATAGSTCCCSTSWCVCHFCCVCKRKLLGVRNDARVVGGGYCGQIFSI